MTQAQQQADLEQQERLYYEISGRLHGLVMQNLLDVKDFEEILYSFGILTQWKKEQK